MNSSARSTGHQKLFGQFYTPPDVARTLVSWAVQSKREKLIDPSCGDGAFLSSHNRSVGVEVDSASAALARLCAPKSRIYESDFFEWASETSERFEVAAGNPPFIRYQRFSGMTRQQALALCAKQGANFSGLTSSWAPFLVVVASLLKPDGRMAFVVPAEIGHSTYARELLEWLCGRFEYVQIIAFREKIFPHLSEDAWFLYCRGLGGSTDHIYLTALDRFRDGMQLPRFAKRVDLASWREHNYRLRRFLLSDQYLSLYSELFNHPSVVRLSAVGHAGIGYVTGANDFFHLRPSDAQKRGIPNHLLRVAVRKAEQLPPVAVDDDVVKQWVAQDQPVLLLDLGLELELPEPVARYLVTADAEVAKRAYKCRVRDPWYVVPDVKVPDAFLAYMSTKTPNLVRNDARCVCTNSVHAVTLKDGISVRDLQRAWNHPLCELSCELEGHPLGGGLLKLEPREAGRVCLPLRCLELSRAQREMIQAAIGETRGWRHYD